jgi:hypothetical protein
MQRDGSVVVFRESIDAAQSDIDRFAQLYPMNARPMQQRKRRFVVSEPDSRSLIGVRRPARLAGPDRRKAELGQPSTPPNMHAGGAPLSHAGVRNLWPGFRADTRF